MCVDSQDDNAGNGGALSISISGESITAHTALTVTNCDMKSNSADGSGTWFACEVIVTVVMFSGIPVSLFVYEDISRMCIFEEQGSDAYVVWYLQEEELCI